MPVQSSMGPSRGKPVMPSESDPAPPWGYFPIEQYLARHWDYESNLSFARRAAPSAGSGFNEEDFLDPELYAAVANGGKVSRVPNESEVREILLPFRPERMRKVARVYVDCLADNWRWQEPILLRTYYGGGATDGQNMSQWIPSDKGGVGLNKGDRWWRLLNAESLFDSGDDWSKVYEILPEVIAYRNDRKTSLDMDRILRAAKKSMSEGTWTEKLESILQAEIQDSSRSALIIFDKVFFDTHDLTLEQRYAIAEEKVEEGPLLIFLDKKGNQIRASRVGQLDQPMKIFPQRR